MNSGQLDWQQTNIDNIGYRLVEHNQQQYVGRQVARWRMTVEPCAAHFDKACHRDHAAPNAGSVPAAGEDGRGGNESFIIVWVDDTAIVKKPLAGKTYYFVADAATGKPIFRANLEFFGWQMHYEYQPPRHEVITRQFAEFTDADGRVGHPPWPSASVNSANWRVMISCRGGWYS